MANWHVDQSGKRIGPITQDVLMQMVTAGHIKPTDMVWTEGMQAWQRADTQSWFPGGPQGTVLLPSDQSINSFSNYVPPAPPSLMVWSIVEIFCCCLIGGIIGIVYDSNAKTAYARGDYDAAQAAYKTGKMWLIIGAVVGAIFSVIYIFATVATTMNKSFN